MANSDTGREGIGLWRLAGGTRHDGEAPSSTVTSELAKPEKKQGERKKEMAGDPYLGRSSVEVRLERC
jgi:hypothetical protein